MVAVYHSSSSFTKDTTSSSSPSTTRCIWNNLSPPISALRSPENLHYVNTINMHHLSNYGGDSPRISQPVTIGRGKTTSTIPKPPSSIQTQQEG